MKPSAISTRGSSWCVNLHRLTGLSPASIRATKDSLSAPSSADAAVSSSRSSASPRRRGAG